MVQLRQKDAGRRYRIGTGLIGRWQIRPDKVIHQLCIFDTGDALQYTPYPHGCMDAPVGITVIFQVGIKSSSSTRMDIHCPLSMSVMDISITVLLISGAYNTPERSNWGIAIIDWLFF